MRIRIPLPFSRRELAVSIDGTVQPRDGVDMIIQTPLRTLGVFETTEESFKRMVSYGMPGPLPSEDEEAQHYRRYCLMPNCEQEIPLIGDWYCPKCRDDVERLCRQLNVGGY